MSTQTCIAIVASLAFVSLGSTVGHAQQAAPPQLPQSPNMTFFITSIGPGKGADLGGLEGADRHCQTLAERVGAGGKTWRAYLSTQAVGGSQAVNARDRIGRGPWQNFKGEVIAQNVDDLHSDDRTCGNWTSSTQGAAMVGHSDRRGLRDDAPSKSWNSSHPSRGPDGGCSQSDLRGTGGNGYFYCFAAN
jgi:hypothetical protein